MEWGLEVEDENYGDIGIGVRDDWGLIRRDWKVMEMRIEFGYNDHFCNIQMSILMINKYFHLKSYETFQFANKLESV